MPLDGIVLSNIAYEIESFALNVRIDKIHQPEADEIILAVRGYGENRKLLLSANPSHPKICFTDAVKENPNTAPLFCMVLRKYLAGGKIIAVKQPGFERILEIHVESMNEMGDMSVKRLIIEIMGKHSNIILVSEAGIIIDSIKRVSLDKSSVRQVLPGRDYVYPPSQDKLDPTELEKNSFLSALEAKNSMKAQEAIYKTYSGISPLAASEICVRADINPSDFLEEINQDKLCKLYDSFMQVFDRVMAKSYTPFLYFEESGKLKDFSSIELTMLESLDKKSYESISALLCDFYKQKDAYYRTSQKSQDLKKIVVNHIERTVRKKEILSAALDEALTRDELKHKGELITSNIYSIKQGQSVARLIDFYDENAAEIDIELDATLTPAENAQSYFKKYNKQKRTHEAALIQMKSADEDLYYLESVLNSLEMNLSSDDIEEIRQELKDQGYIKKSAVAAKKKTLKKSKPMRFKSSDGFEILVGKNNRQNDELTMEIAEPTDMWLHTKNIPGSHVIIKTGGQTPPDKTIEEAANLAVYFSKGRNSSMVGVDYTLRKFIKKPNSAKLGMVVYTTYNTAYITAVQEVLDSLNQYGEIL